MHTAKPGSSAQLCFFFGDAHFPEQLVPAGAPFFSSSSLSFLPAHLLTANMSDARENKKRRLEELIALAMGDDDGEVEKLKQQLAARDHEIEGLKQQLGVRNHEIEGLKENLGAKDREIETLKQQFQDLMCLEEENGFLKEEVNKLRNDNAGFVENAKFAEKTISELNSLLKNEKATSQQVESRMQGRIEEIEDRATTLEVKMKAKEIAATAKINELINENQVLKQNSGEYEQKWKLWEKKYGQLEKDVKKVEGELGEIPALKKLVGDLESQLQKANEDVERLCVENQTASEWEQEAGRKVLENKRLVDQLDKMKMEMGDLANINQSCMLFSRDVIAPFCETLANLEMQMTAFKNKLNPRGSALPSPADPDDHTIVHVPAPVKFAADPLHYQSLYLHDDDGLFVDVPGLGPLPPFLPTSFE